ncbi:hypothetical protein P7C71_g4710, partial [Lecanoromycetidae sp. Uapishka_2]
MAVVYEWAEDALRYLRPMIPAELRGPVIGIICGSGLNGLADTVISEPQFSIPYKDIPHFQSSTVPGHVGKLLFGLLDRNKSPVILMVGRLQSVSSNSSVLISGLLTMCPG